MVDREAERARRRAYYEAHKAEIVAKATAWNKAHPERARAHARAAAARHREKYRAKLKAWRAANPEKVRAQWERAAHKRHAAHIRRKFGLTKARYAEMLANQRGGCAICGRSETRKGRGGKIMPLAVDHSHEGGHVRGLLCDDCNNGLGRFRDDADLLVRAAQYLRKHAR